MTSPPLSPTTELLAAPDVDAIYCAVPHHLHTQIYGDIIRAGKHLLGEKPFGIDLAANDQILTVLREHPRVFVRCASEFPFFPGAYQITKFIQEGRFGKIIEVESGLWHSSDLDPNKPINWKRMVQFNGEYGCLAIWGCTRCTFHCLRLAAGQCARAAVEDYHRTADVRGHGTVRDVGQRHLACEVKTAEQHIPHAISTKRIAPAKATLVHQGSRTEFSAEFQHEIPKTLRTMTIAPASRRAGRRKTSLCQRYLNDHRRHL